VSVRPPDENALRELEERLQRASAAAERLISEAAGAATPPPSGWRAADGEPPRHAGVERELEVLLELARALRDLVGPELRQRLAEALRELLLALRAVIDFYLERLERRSAGREEPRDIPII
jgi:hypothetical protein